MPKLIVIGDSFAALSQDDTQRHPRLWMSQLGRKLKADLYCWGCPGSSQDWLMTILHSAKNELTSEDYIVLVFTHPTRFWFFEDAPDVCNPFIVDFDKYVSPEKVQTVINYYKHIQRDPLDLIHQESRLGHIANMARVRGWRDPIIINAFDTDYPRDEFTNLKISKGNLTQGPSNKELEDYNKIMDTFVEIGDPRYNHMCLDNHDVLADKLYHTFTTNAELDLTQGFFENIIKTDFLSNQEFCNEQLNPYILQNVEKRISKFRRNDVAFYIRAGLTHLSKQF